MSTVLLVGAGLLLRSMSAYQSIDYGYEPDGLVGSLGRPSPRCLSGTP